MANIVVDNVLALIAGGGRPIASIRVLTGDQMPRPLGAVTDSPFPRLIRRARAGGSTPELRMAASVPDDILAVASEADAVLVTYAKLPGELLRQLARCKVIGRFGLGVDNIDIKTAVELGITVTYVPDYCMHEVSDHAMALMLALARKIVLSNKLVQSGRCEISALVPIHRLAAACSVWSDLATSAPLAPKAKAPGCAWWRMTPCGASGIRVGGVEAVGFEELLQSRTSSRSTRRSCRRPAACSMPKPFAR